MRELMLQWYAILSIANAAVSQPLRALADFIGVAPASALLFGLIGTTAPCQLTTNASALAYVAGRSADRGSIARNALAYLVAKVLVYTVIGLAVILVARQLAQSSVPVIVVARKVLGPLMVLLGFYLLGVPPLRFSLGSGIAAWFEDRAGQGVAGAFLLGAAFSFAFCPTLFLLFFGLTLPLALISPVGVLYPGIFALGTALPLLGVVAVLTAGAGAKEYVGGTRRIDSWVRPVAAIVLILAGLNDTIVYWFL